MSDIVWGSRQVGGSSMVAEEMDGGFAVVLGEPDWVRLPDVLGGQQRRVLAIGPGPCVIHPDHQAKHYALEGEFWCCECVPTGKFYWYRAPAREGE